MRGHWISLRTTTGMLVCSALLAFVVWIGPPLDVALPLFNDGGIIGLQEFAQNIAADPSLVLTAPLSWLQHQYAHTPTLVLGLIAVLMVPSVAAFSGFMRAVNAWRHGDRRPVVSKGDRDLGSKQADYKSTYDPDLYVPRQALLEVFDGLGEQNLRRVPISSPVVQIGRSDDVDININDASVHRYHAAIERRDDCGYRIMDLSAGTGNGVVVNGQRILNHALHNGDEIRIGRTKLRFATHTR